jgi:hypothetical protein
VTSSTERLNTACRYASSAIMAAVLGAQAAGLSRRRDADPCAPQLTSMRRCAQTVARQRI